MVKNEKFFLNTVHTTNEGYDIKIVGILKGNYRLVKFLDEHEHISRCRVDAISRKNIKNPYHKSVYGVGCLGVGNGKSSFNNNDSKPYKIWHSMIQRCYNEKHQQSSKNLKYKNVKVCEEWHNYQNFLKFYEENNPKIDGIKFHIDKDLLQQKLDEKIYSPYTCIFLPEKINLFLSNKQSKNKSGYIGVHWCNTYKKWVSKTNDFVSGKSISIGKFTDINEASLAYQKARAIQAEHAKNYLRSLNYLSEDIIQLIK